jgi:hypothetical protein
LFKAVASVNKVLATVTVKGGKPKARYAVKHISDMANYYVPTAGDIYKITTTVNASFLGWED